MPDEDELFERKKLDGFTTESPLRAFTTFEACGNYALGRGFRPSYGHLAKYLDSIEAIEGWSLVQILLPRTTSDGFEATMVFRRSGVPGESAVSDPDTLARLRYLQEENTRLRAALAMSDQPCVYCSLPLDDMSKCQSGFPGCARADDAVGCPHLGAGLEVERLTEEKLDAENLIKEAVGLLSDLLPKDRQPGEHPK